MEKKNTIIVDGKEFPINGERNLLELIRKGDIDIPTFCYHSELSIYGACRLCMVDVEGRGLLASCSITPEPGMKIKTNTKQLRETRKVILELLLANHDLNCTTCSRSDNCELQKLARRFGVDAINLHHTNKDAPLDTSSHSIVRNPNKCVLCGDCVRYCDEIQSIGAIDFAHRGSEVEVLPAFGEDLANVECVNCGQCARVCPTAALVPKQEINEVWDAIYDETKTVVVQAAPAVRVAVGEYFGMPEGSVTTGKVVAALRDIGFNKVFDTSFAADLTVMEESTEFLERVSKGEKLPQFTSCCPAWVTFAEQYYPELLGNLSSCKSPQQMFGSLAKKTLPETLGVAKKDLVVVAIMPCTAKKFEAKREEFYEDGMADVDHVITTQELCRMIEEAGIQFDNITPDSLDMPLGFKTGAGVIFGTTGGVSEAVLRHAVEKLSGETLEAVDFKEVRGSDVLREAEFTVNGNTVRLAVVHGLGNARKIAEQVKAGESKYDLVEVMACPHGCVGGAGQPIARDISAVEKRAESLYNIDKTLQLHKSQDNPYIKECYEKTLGEVGGETAHHLLHTSYSVRKRTDHEGIGLYEGKGDKKVEVKVCVGTNCFLKGSQEVLKAIINEAEAKGFLDNVDIKASFCFEKCGTGPTVAIGDELVNEATADKVLAKLNEKLSAIAKA